jgi:alkanesulfonate monooxygenase SsuD/methylene tetrahydromethanopterin reductase-like flavin-dependent oxidoreductase (luciferase family)
MPVDFGIRLPNFPPDGNKDVNAFYDRTLNALSEHVTTVWISDHLQKGESPFFEGWTRLTYLAAKYPRFKFGHLVLCQSYRNPALLAKMGATLQYLTGGRFILGLGAGWQKDEYDSYGFDFPTPGARVEQLAETIEIVRAMWTQSPATYHGKHYHIENAYCEPRPVPLPPIYVGTNGRRAIGVAARLADGWNWDYAMEVYEPPFRILKEQCEEIGRDLGEISLTAAGSAHFPEDPSEFELPDLTRLLEEPKLGPTPADAIEQLRPLVELGVTHFQVFFEDHRTLERFCAEVAPVISRL